MAGVTLEQAQKIIEVGLEHGRKNKLKPLGIAVLDPGGHLIAFARDNGTSYFRPHIAMAKAHGALGMGMGSRALVGRPDYFMYMLNAASDGKALNAPGGVIIRDKAGEILGAVGVTGDVSDRDEDAAVAGIKAVGLEADTG
ncbi:MAG: heme-binding protein [Alphaproteobacteria bacterium]